MSTVIRGGTIVTADMMSLPDENGICTSQRSPPVTVSVGGSDSTWIVCSPPPGVPVRMAPELLTHGGLTLDEAVEAMLSARTGEPFDYHGTRVRVTPVPRTKPHPHVMIGGSGRPAARRAAESFPLFAPWPYIHRIEQGNPADPLLRQVLPLSGDPQTQDHARFELLARVTICRHVSDVVGQVEALVQRAPAN